jgi:CelD/BcsL family acetyltransferase involved in cellulose biosynthesis
MHHVREINELDELTSYRLAWQSLLSQTRQASFFQSLDWLEPYWRHYGREQRLRAIVVSSGSDVLGILPLVIRAEQTRLGRLRVLTYPLHDWGSFYAPIGSEPTATLLAGLAHIKRTPRDWDLLDLRWVDKRGTDRGRTQRAMAALGFEPHERPWDCAAMISLSGTWDEYWASRQSHWRTNVRRSQRKVAALGAVEHVRYRPAGATHGEADPRWDLYDACERLAERSWQGSSDTGTTMSHAQIRDYLRDAHAAACTAGGVDLNLLLLGGQPAAFAYNYVYQGYVFGLRAGFDADASRDGLGSVLTARMIEDSFRRGDHTFDLGTGYLDCKRYWHTSLETCYRYTHYPLGAARAQALRLGHWARQWWGAGKAVR